MWTSLEGCNSAGHREFCPGVTISTGSKHHSPKAAAVRPLCTSGFSVLALFHSSKRFVIQFLKEKGPGSDKLGIRHSSPELSLEGLSLRKEWPQPQEFSLPKALGPEPRTQSGKDTGYKSGWP